MDLNSVMVICLEEILTKSNENLLNFEKDKYIYLKDVNW